LSKAVVLDSDPSGHGANVKSYFLNDAPSGWSCDVLSDGSTTVNDIIGSYDLVIRSMTGVWGRKSDWDKLVDNNIPVVHTHGSNSNDKLVNPPRLFSAITVGGEDPDDNDLDDETSYGNGLEIDAIAHDGSTAQSYTAPTIAAALVKAYENTNNWWDARALIRQSASNYQSGWTPETGFGYYRSGDSIESNVELQPPLDIVVDSNGAEWINFETSNWKNTVITIKSTGQVLYRGKETVFKFSTIYKATFTLEFYSEDDNGNLSSSKDYLASTSSNLEIDNVSEFSNLVNNNLNITVTV